MHRCLTPSSSAPSNCTSTSSHPKLRAVTYYMCTTPAACAIARTAAVPTTIYRTSCKMYAALHSISCSLIVCKLLLLPYSCRTRPKAPSSSAPSTAAAPKPTFWTAATRQRARPGAVRAWGLGSRVTVGCVLRRVVYHVCYGGLHVTCDGGHCVLSPPLVSSKPPWKALLIALERLCVPTTASCTLSGSTCLPAFRAPRGHPSNVTCVLAPPFLMLFPCYVLSRTLGCHHRRRQGQRTRCAATAPTQAPGAATPAG